MTDANQNPCSVLVDQHIAANRGEVAALKYGEKRYTFNDLAALTNRAGNVFRDLGFVMDDRIAVLIRPSPAYFAAILGAMKIGAVPIVADSAAGTANAKAIIVDDEQVNEIDDSTGAIVLVVSEDGGAYQSFVALLRAGTSSLTAVPRADTSPALELVGADGNAQTLSCSSLTEATKQPEHVLTEYLAALSRAEAIRIDRTD